VRLIAICLALCVSTVALWFDDDDFGILRARAYIGLSILGRTERFERVVEQ